MYKIIQDIIFKVVALISLLILQGCASTSWRIDDAGVKIELVPSDKVIMHPVLINEKPDGFSMFGDLSQRRAHAPGIKGHVDVDLLDSKGQVLRTDTTYFRRFGKLSRPYRRYKYTIDIPQIPPNDGVIRVSHHEAEAH